MSKLPDGFTVRSKKEWEELLDDNDTTKKGLVNIALRSLGLAPGAYLKLSKAEKVEYIMKRQAEAGAGEEEAPKASGKPKATGAAEQAAKPAQAATPAAQASGGSSGSSGGDAALRKQVADLQAQVVDLGKEIIEIKRLVKDIHFLARVETLANSELAANSEDSGIREEFYGKPLEGNE